MSNTDGEKTDTADSCQNNFHGLVEATSPDTRSLVPLRRKWWKLLKRLRYVAALGGPVQALSAMLKRPRTPSTIIDLGLQVGDLVTVRPASEIYATLDKRGKLKGLAFNQEQVKFCGKQFRVYKRLDRIIVESTGELRRIKTPTVMLEGVFCDGSAHGGCDRSCFCFWREAWLERAPPPKSDAPGGV